MVHSMSVSYKQEWDTLQFQLEGVSIEKRKEVILMAIDNICSKSTDPYASIAGSMARLALYGSASTER